MTACFDLYRSADACRWIQLHCYKEDPWMATYLSFLYCRLGKLDFFALGVLLIWLSIIFSVFGRAASRFMCPNLSSIAAFLRLPNSIAGVTLAALGNGAPDLFSTFASARADAFPMALGELIGAANFITMVVVGVIVLVSPFKVPRWPFLRDNIAFLLASYIVLCAIVDGNIYFMTSVLLMIYYMLYVAVVVTGSYIQKKMKALTSAAPQIDSSENELSLTIPSTSLNHPIEETEDSFGVPLDLPSAISFSVSRPGSPTLGEYSLPRRLSAVSSIASTSHYQAGLSVSSQVKDVVQAIQNHSLRRGTIRLPEDDEASVVSFGNEEDLLLPITQNEQDTISLSNSFAWYLDLIQILCPTIYFWKSLRPWERFYAVLTLPSDFILSLVTPVISRVLLENLRKECKEAESIDMGVPASPLLDEDDTKIEDCEGEQNSTRLSKVMSVIQLGLGPFLVNWIFGNGSLISWMNSLVSSLGLSMIGYYCMYYTSLHRAAFFLALYGFVMSSLGIYVISNALISLIKAFGIAFSINQTLLGLTVLAVGNSLLDLIANANIARLGMPIMAMGASYGSPMLNIMLGLCASVAYAILSTPSSTPLLNRYLLLGPFPPSLLLSFVALLGTLLFSLVYMIFNDFYADRRFGWILVGGYNVLMVSQIWLECSLP